MEVIVGILISFAIGVTGIGGSTLTTPLIFVFGLRPGSQLATALLFFLAS